MIVSGKIMKIDFENDFEERILQRGYNYYLEGLVDDVFVDGNNISAKVDGTEVYSVEVTIDRKKVIDSYCNCPYFEDNNECKHIAALLYYINNEDIKEHNKKTSKKQNIQDVLNKIDVNDLKAFLLDLLNSNEKIYDIFRKKFMNYFEIPSLSDYRNRVRGAIYAVGDKDGFIDYKGSYDYAKAMNEFIDEAYKLIENNRFNMAFELITCILDEIPNLAIDDSNGSTIEIGVDCTEVIYDILDRTIDDFDKNPVVKQIFNYVSNELITSDLSNYGIEIKDIINIFIEDGRFSKECEEVLLKAISGLEKDDWYSDYRKQEYIEYLINLYEITDEYDKKFELIKKNIDIFDIFKKYIEILKQEKSLQEIIKILKDYRIEHKNNEKGISDILINIYKNNDMTEEYKKELYDAFYIYDKYDFKVFEKIKSLYNKNEWKDELYNILSKIDRKEYKSFDLLSNIFIEENMIDDLFNLIKDSSFETITRYEQYTKELLSIYIEHCNSQLLLAQNRKAYQYLARNLRHIKKIKNGDMLVNKFIIKLKEKYPNKPALIDEISKI